MNRLALVLITISIAISCFCQNVFAQEHISAPLISKTLLSADDLQYGEQQTEAMVQDRPRMFEFAGKGNPIWEWTARQFAGEGIGSRIYWNKGKIDKPPEYGADHCYPNKWNKTGFIRMTSTDRFGRPACGEELWGRAVFELHNIQNAPAFEKAHLDALAGKTSKDEYIRENTMLEYAADRKTMLFYRNVIQPYAHKNGKITHGYYWQTPTPKDYDSWIARYKNHSGYPWDSWGAYYDKIAAYRTEVAAYQSRYVAYSFKYTIYKFFHWIGAWVHWLLRLVGF